MLEKCIVNTNSTWYKIIKAKPSYICSLPSEVTALMFKKSLLQKIRGITSETLHKNHH